jgi:peptide-methionine (S)-S-oxide reductase
MRDHTECFQVDFDSQVVSYEELLELSLTSHDPTRAAYKEQYASLALTQDDAQLATARAVAERFESRLGRKLATRIEPIKRFYPAEDYHQKYYLRNDRILMADFRAMFGSDDAVFRESTSAARVNGFAAGDGAREQLDAEIDLFGLSDEGRTRLASRVRGGSFSGGCSI